MNRFLYLLVAVLTIFILPGLLIGAEIRYF